jgi:hypothetical protein
MMKPYKLVISVAGLLIVWCVLPASGLRTGHSGTAEGSHPVDNQAAFSRLRRRHLNLPAIPAGERCPVSNRTRNPGPHTGYFGKGPVFFALTWSDPKGDEARFALQGVPYEERAYRAKTPWISRPDYTGPILIRGRRLDGGGADRLRFRLGHPKPTAELELESPARERADPSDWSFWATSMFVPGPGCYGVRIDTNNGTDVVVFEATQAP